jgi:hypothetical protein
MSSPVLEVATLVAGLVWAVAMGLFGWWSYRALGLAEPIHMATEPEHE